jgi:hypothetical protein
MQLNISISTRKYRNIVSTQFLIGILSSEFPLNRFAFGVPVSLPSDNLALQQGGCGDAAIQALAAEDADFDLRHVEPAGMLGRVVEPNSSQELDGITFRG